MIDTGTRAQRGVCIWLTGLSGAGKTTIAGLLATEFRARGHDVTLLDGDVVRASLSSDLGFTKQDRDNNVRRMAFVASEAVRQGHVAICALVSPYRETRAQCRAIVGERFVEVFVDAPLALCETRDVKGMYARARRGELLRFTGIDDPYEEPLNPDVHLLTAECAPEISAQQVMAYLTQAGAIAP